MHERTRKIRDFINEPRRQHVLIKNLARWHKLCSALDVVEDTSLALEAYLAGPTHQDTGDRYLSVYGALQALFVQQDAVLDLSESLGIPVALINYPRLKEIREVRNASIGHPTEKSEKQGLTSYHFMVRVSLSRNGFDLSSLYSDGREETKFVSVPDLIGDQERLVGQILESVIAYLQDEEKSHKEAFRKEKLASLFRHLSYHCEKLSEGIGKLGHVGHAGLSEVAIRGIKRILAEFKASMERRGMELATYDSVKDVYDELEYPLAELTRYFTQNEPKEGAVINEETALIFAWFVCERMRSLNKIAEEIDEEYSS